MPPDELIAVVKDLRRRPLCGNGAGTVDFRAAVLEALLPHRPPFLLIDAVDGFDIDAQTIRGRRRLAKDDPVFRGHFPGRPVYPGVLQIETMGQLAICLAGLKAGDGASAGTPARMMMTKVLHAQFLEPLLPGDELVIHARVLEDDGLVAVTAGQIYKGVALAALAVQEGCYVD